MYGKKEGLKKVKEKFIKLDEATIERIIIAVPKYLQSKTVKDGFKKNPLTWLNGEHWNDDIETKAQSTKKPWEVNVL